MVATALAKGMTGGLLGAEYYMDHVLRVCVGHVSHLRRLPFYTLGTQRSHAGLTSGAPTALGERHGRVGQLSAENLLVWCVDAEYKLHQLMVPAEVGHAAPRRGRFRTVGQAAVGVDRGRTHSRTTKQVYGGNQGQRHSPRDCCSLDSGRVANSVRVAPARPAGQTGYRPSAPEEGSLGARVLLACAPMPLWKGHARQELAILAGQAREEPRKG